MGRVWQLGNGVRRFYTPYAGNPWGMPEGPEEIVDCLEQLGINILIVIGGAGSLRAAQTIAGIIAERGLRIAVVGCRRRSTAPKGISVGDRFLTAETLSHAGAIAGRVELDCVAVDARFEGETCQMTLLLRDGQVAAQSAGLNRTLAGVAPTSTGAGDEFAITGGTRASRGASGTVVIKAAPSGDTVTVAFAP